MSTSSGSREPFLHIAWTSLQLWGLTVSRGLLAYCLRVPIFWETMLALTLCRTRACCSSSGCRVPAVDYWARPFSPPLCCLYLCVEFSIDTRDRDGVEASAPREFIPAIRPFGLMFEAVDRGAESEEGPELGLFLNSWAQWAQSPPKVLAELRAMFFRLDYDNSGEVSSPLAAQGFVCVEGSGICQVSMAGRKQAIETKR